MALAFILILQESDTAFSSDKKPKILILPFNMHSEKDLSYLQKGIEEMLSTRLAFKDTMIISEKENVAPEFNNISPAIDKNTAFAIAKKTEADYVLFGSLTVLGEIISTDAKFYDIHSETPIVVFSKTGNMQGDVIHHIDELALKIRESISVKDRNIKSEKFLTEDNETTLSKKKNKVKIFSDDAGSSPVEHEAVLWKSKQFKTKLKCISLGDIDNDSKIETVLADDHNIYIYRKNGKNFEKVKEINGESNLFYKSVDIADINGNKTDEIFITGVDDSGRVLSFVLEWNGKSFIKIAYKTEWYYRIIDLPARGGKVLFGQKSGFRDIFSGDIYALKWVNGKYLPAKKEFLPKGINVYAFTKSDLLNSGQEMILGFDNSNYLRLFDVNGNEEWISSDTYGESSKYLESSKEIEESQKIRHDPDPMPQNRLYLPQRIFVDDIDKDGKKEVLLVKNIDTTGGVFSRVRVFKSGFFECLLWDNVGLAPKWKTRTFSGYISDYTFDDIDNDGSDEVIFLLVTQNGYSIFGSDKSYVVIWKMNGI